MKNQIKSKERVSDHGEVYTAEREIKAMCKLVECEIKRVESKFLEPSCGDGNFLDEILHQKLDIIKNKPIDKYDLYSFLIISNLYGIDILKDNIQECKERLFHTWQKKYKLDTNNYPDDDLCKTIKYILDKNIVLGDSLKMMYKNKPIIFSEWKLVDNNMVLRNDYRFDYLINSEYQNKILNNEHEQISLFGDSNDGTYRKFLELDKNNNIVIPKSIKTYPLIYYKEIGKYEK